VAHECDLDLIFWTPVIFQKEKVWWTAGLIRVRRDARGHLLAEQKKISRRSVMALPVEETAQRPRDSTRESLGHPWNRMCTPHLEMPFGRHHQRVDFPEDRVPSAAGFRRNHYRDLDFAMSVQRQTLRQALTTWMQGKAKSKAVHGTMLSTASYTGPGKRSAREGKTNGQAGFNEASQLKTVPWAVFPESLMLDDEFATIFQQSHAPGPRNIPD